MSCDDFYIDSMVKGKDIDININECDCDIKRDIILPEYSTIRIWGQVRNCCGKPICGVLLNLLKVFECCHKEPYYEGVSHTVTDDNGFYQFDICANDSHKHYKILAHKAALDSECEEHNI